LVLIRPHPDAQENTPWLIDSAGDRYYIGGVASKRGHGERLRTSYLHPGLVFGASGSSAFYRREALDRIGYFPESFGAYFEDVDVSFRLHWAGYQVAYEPRARILHHVSASYGRAGRRLLEQQFLNEERVYWRNLPGRLLLASLPRHLGVLIAKAVKRWEEGTLTPFIMGRLRLLAELPALIQYRRQLRKLWQNATAPDWALDHTFLPCAGLANKGPNCPTGSSQ
jgi:GT2 family glycosyltransferase